MKTLGRLVKESRLKRGMKGYELAQKAGIHQTYVTYIEKHGKTPSLPVLKKLEEALGVDLHPAYINETVHPELRPDLHLKTPSGEYFIELKTRKANPKNKEESFFSDLYMLIFNYKNENGKNSTISFIKKWVPAKASNKNYITEWNETLKNLRRLCPEIISADNSK